MFKLKIKKRVIITLLILAVIVVVAIFFATKKEKGAEYITAKVVRKDLIQTVSEVGTVKASSEIELSFLSAGKVAKKSVEVGDEVKKEQILGELDYQSLLIQRKEAQSNLDVARANLNKTLSGATSYEIAVLDAQVKKANQSYLSALENLEKSEQTVLENISQAEKTLSDLELDGEDNITTYEQTIAGAKIDLKNTKITYQKDIDNYTDSALTTIDAKLAVANTALDEIDSIINNTELDDYLSAKNSAYLIGTRETYDRSLALLNEALDDLLVAKANKSRTNVDQAVDNAVLTLNEVFDSLNYCYSALEASTITQSTLNTYKTAINTEITTVSAGLSSVQSSKQNLGDAEIAYDTNISNAEDTLKQAEVALDNQIISAKNALANARTSGDEKIATAKANKDTAKETWEVVKRELANLKAPARIEDVALYKAKVSQAQASLDLINKQIEDSIIRSPIDGKVVKDEYNVGEQVLVGKSAFSILGENNFEIEVDISESDIAKVNEGQGVMITMDAFGEEEEFIGEVSFVEPAETVISEVIYYKVKIKFLEVGEKMSQVKSGMTANVIITTNEKKNVLVIPSRVIVERTKEGMGVRVLKNGIEEKIYIKTGIRGDGGLTEVISGLKEGEEVIVSIKK